MKSRSRSVVKPSTAAVLFALSLAPTAQAAAPGFNFPLASRSIPQAEAAPFAGQVNYGTENRAYRWGWFGAEHFYPTNQTHREYSGDVMRWSRWPRF